MVSGFIGALGGGRDNRSSMRAVRGVTQRSGLKVSRVGLAVGDAATTAILNNRVLEQTGLTITERVDSFARCRTIALTTMSWLRLAARACAGVDEAMVKKKGG